MSLTKLQGSELGLGIQYSAAVSEGRTLVFTAGVPLDVDVKGLNEIVDKLERVTERQALFHKIRTTEEFIAKCEGDLERNRAQLATYRSAAAALWDTRKRGEFRPTESQQKDINNYENTERTLVANIKKLRSDVDEMKKKAA